MKTENEGLKSIYLELENFKNLDKVRIDIDGKSLLFIGKNGSGKSTLIQAMMSPMNMKALPSDPVKKGEEKAKIVHKIAGTIGGEYKEYIMEVFFSQKDKKGRLVVKNEKGETLKSPAQLVKNIIGNVSFNVTQWLNDPKAKKLETIKSLSGVGKQVDMVNVAIKDLKDKRKYSSDRAEELKNTLNNHEFDQNEVSKYSAPQDITPLQSEMSAIGQKQNQWDDIKNQTEGYRQKEKSGYDAIQSAENEIDRLKALITAQEALMTQKRIEISKAQQNVQKGETWLQNNPRPLIEDITQRINEAITHNEKHSRIKMLSEQQKEMIKCIEQVDEISASIETNEGKRASIIAQSQLPIEGLTFSEEDLFIDGLPLEAEQINTARLWQIGVQVAKALNPNYKGIFLPDSSLFDKHTLHAIIQEIEKDGYFAICEIVDFNEGPLHVEYAETYL